MYEEFIKKHKSFSEGRSDRRSDRRSDTTGVMSIKLNYRNIGYASEWKQLYLDLLAFRLANSLR